MSIERRMALIGHLHEQYSEIGHTHAFSELTGTVAASQVDSGSSGNRWGIIPVVDSSGYMEIGKYVDFHETDGDTDDYDFRVSVASGVLTASGEFNVDGGCLRLQRSGDVNLWMKDSSQALDEKNWRFVTSAGDLWLQAYNDALSNSRQALRFNRSGLAVSEMQYGNGTDLPGHLFFGTIQPQNHIMLSGTRLHGDSATTDTFTYNGDTIPHYGLVWYNDSNFGGLTAALSGYYGIRMFAAGNLKLSLDNNTAYFDCDVRVYRNGGHLIMYEQDAADANDFGLVEVNSNELGIYGYDNSAATYRKVLTSNLTTGNLALGTTTGQIGFFNSTGATKPTVSGSRGGNAALASLCTALANLGLITNSTT